MFTVHSRHVGPHKENYISKVPGSLKRAHISLYDTISCDQNTSIFRVVANRPFAVGEPRLWNGEPYSFVKLKFQSSQATLIRAAVVKCQSKLFVLLVCASLQSHSTASYIRRSSISKDFFFWGGYHWTFLAAYIKKTIEAASIDTASHIIQNELPFYKPVCACGTAVLNHKDICTLWLTGK